MHTALEILLYALIAAASPLALTATVAVLKSRRARLNGLIFASAFLLGEAIGWLLALLFGSIVDLGTGDRKIAAALEVALGALLLAAAWRVHRGFTPRVGERTGRTREFLARLENLRPATAFWAGTLLGVGVPKRLTITIVASVALATSGLSVGEKLSLVVLYIVVAAVLVWAPVAIYVVAGQRASNLLSQGQEWLSSNQRSVTIYTLLAFGGLLLADGLLQL